MENLVVNNNYSTFGKSFVYLQISFEKFRFRILNWIKLNGIKCNEKGNIIYSFRIFDFVSVV